MFGSYLRKTALAALAVTAMLGFVAKADATTVNVQLAMGVDVSGSVDATEYALQMGGYVAAFNSLAVQNAIANSPDGVAVMLYQWSGNGQQAVSVVWTHLKTAADSIAFAADIQAATATRFYSGLTGIAQAITFGATEIANNGFDSARKVIDISGDGTENVNSLAQLQAARDAAVTAGISINGLAILNDVATLDTYYANNVIGGDKSFVLSVAAFEDFAQAVTRKIVFEITGTDPNASPIPLPAAGWLLLTALGGLGLYGRRRALAA